VDVDGVVIRVEAVSPRSMPIIETLPGSGEGDAG
jgi:hypothetical protein